MHASFSEALFCALFGERPSTIRRDNLVPHGPNQQNAMFRALPSSSEFVAQQEFTIRLSNAQASQLMARAKRILCLGPSAPDVLSSPIIEMLLARLADPSKHVMRL